MNSIRLRLLLSLLAMLALAALAMAALTYRSVLAETEALFDYQLRQMALSLRDQGEIAPRQAGVLTDEQLDFVVQIWTVDGRSIYASRQHPALPARALLGLADVEAGGQVWRTFGVATPQRVIQVAQPRQIRRRLAANAAWRAVAPLVVLAPAIALAIWWLAALTLRPLRRVAREVRGRDGSSLEPLAARGLPEEVATLVDALNALLQRLSKSIDVQRAFVSDAAHELRSPLTALKLQSQLLRKATDPAMQAEAIDALTEGIDRAVKLVEQLLQLARLEPGAPAAAMSPVDLAEIVRQAIADNVPFARSRGIELELSADESAMLVGERAALGILARNLVDNAVRYAPQGSKVDVRVDREGDATRLQVDDAGPGIPPEDRERVFDRFYRRAGTDQEGTGLGLAIVRGVAERHGARIVLGDSAHGGLSVTVNFAERPRGG